MLYLYTQSYSGAQTQVCERVQATIELLASDSDCARIALACAVQVTREWLWTRSHNAPNLHASIANTSVCADEIASVYEIASASEAKLRA